MIYLLEILLALAPSYAIRFSKFDLLEIIVPLFWIACFLIIWSKKELKNIFVFSSKIPKSILIPGFLFILAAIISSFISPTRDRAFGELLAYFIEPAITFFFAAYILRSEANKKKFIGFVLCYIALLAVYSAVQYFTLIGLPATWWGNANEPKRALSIFTYPNAYALFITPLLAYSLPIIFSKQPGTKYYKWLALIGLFGLLLSLSRGGWAGFAVAVLVFALISASKKVWSVLGVGLAFVAILIFSIPNLRYRVILPFKGEKSTVSRFSLWHTAEKMITSSPILGKGLNGFATNFNAYNTDPNLSALDYPHNIFLNFWVETGLLGLLSFLWLSLSSVWIGWKKYVNGNMYGLAIILFFIALYVHGLADAPYFKNDLALVFWIILGNLA